MNFIIKMNGHFAKRVNDAKMNVKMVWNKIVARKNLRFSDNMRRFYGLGDSMFRSLSKIDAKHLRIAFKISYILLESDHTNKFLVDCEQMRYPSCVHIFRVQMFMWNIVRTLSLDPRDLCYFTSILFVVIQNHIMNFIDNHYCCDLIRMTWSWYGFCDRMTVANFNKLLLYAKRNNGIYSEWYLLYSFAFVFEIVFSKKNCVWLTNKIHF